ncbi:MAG: DUF11 domain-containing protein [Clostridia bacterium]|nr:DUF11 domain-containing protein [Clostridia bacterium]
MKINNLKLKLIIAFILALIVIFLPHETKALSAYDFIHSQCVTYDEIMEYSVDECLSLRFNQYSNHEDLVRQACNRYLCCHKSSYATGGLFYPAIVLDIYADDPCTLYQNGSVAIQNNAWVGALAYFCAYYQDYDPHSSYSGAEGQKVNYVLNQLGYDAGSYVNTNVGDATAYGTAALNGTADKYYSARIIILKGGDLQSSGLLWGKEGISGTVRVQKFISEDRASMSKEQKADAPVHLDEPDGSEVTYTIRVTNTHKSETANYTLTDVFDQFEKDGLEFVSGSSWSGSGNTYKITDSLGPGETRDYSLTLKTYNTEIISIPSTDEYEEEMFSPEILDQLQNGQAYDFYAEYENLVTMEAQLGEKTIEAEDADYVEVGKHIDPPPPKVPEPAEPGITLRKYVSQVESGKDGSISTYNRQGMSNSEKYYNPVVLEKGDTVTYTIEFKLNKHVVRYKRSQYDYIYDVQLVDKNEDGLELVPGTDSGLTGFTVWYGDTYTTQVQYKVTKTNMYLFDVENTIQFEEALYNYVWRYWCQHRYSGHWVYVVEPDTSVNADHPDIKSRANGSEVPKTGEAEDGSIGNTEFVQLKELVIAGYVFDDENKDGLMTGDQPLEKIWVTLHDLSTSDGHDFTQSKQTDANGYYEFELESFNKGTFRDETYGIYTKGTSEHRKYYVEFRYNGITYQSTPEYAGRKNLNSDNSFNDNYKIDSNALEYDSERAAFNNQFTTIAHNKGIEFGGDENDSKGLAYDKDEHISTLKWTNSVTMSSYSFVKDDHESRDNLFLSSEGETEYLKYINLGLYQREKLDLSLTKDLYKAQVRINGYTLDYDYDDGVSFPRDIDSNDPNRTYLKDGYELFIYNSDYFYRISQYANEAVRTIKAKTNGRLENAELEIDLTYKVRIANDSPSEFGPLPSNNAIYAAVDELVDYNSDTMTIYKAWMGDENGPGSTELDISDTSIYNDEDNYQYSGFERNFITGSALSENVLKSDETTHDVEYLYITYRVDHENEAARAVDSYADKGFVHLGDKTSISQISAYSTYDDETRSHGHGLVDIDANSGNINTAQTEFSSACDNIDSFEDIAFRVDMNIDKKADERSISGLVFEDTRSDKLQITKFNNAYQFIANGAYLTTDRRHDELSNDPSQTQYELLRNIRGSKQDILLPDMTVQLIEVVTGSDSNLYEETIEPAENTNLNHVIVRTNASGEYKISEFIPGVYIVRFKFGDIFKDETISLESFEHNGQDYKATQYTLGGPAGTIVPTGGSITTRPLESGDDNDTKLAALTKAERVSDARENELRRIEVMSASEVMNNYTATFMKANSYLGENEYDQINNAASKAALTAELNSNGGKVNDEVKAFSDATYSFADTVTFSLGIENKSDTLNQLDKEVGSDKDFNAIFVKANNIDFGVEYRPESYVELVKRIKEIKLTSSAGDIVVDLHYNEDGTLVSNTSVTQVGIENIQAIDTTILNDAIKGFTNNISAEFIQGFRYINVDENILQGAQISINYYLTANNQGEVDTVSQNLIDEGTNNLYDKLKEKMEVDPKFAQAVNSGNLLRFIQGIEKAYIRTPELMRRVQPAYQQGYYMGGIYYYGSYGENTDNTIAIVPLTVHKILDFIDNDALFMPSNNIDTNKTWSLVNEDELLEDNLIERRPESEANVFGDKNSVPQKYNLVEVQMDDGSVKLKFLDDRQRMFTTDIRNNIVINALSNKNSSLVRAIIPKIGSQTPVAERVFTVDNPNRDDIDYSSYIFLEMNQTLSSENSSEDMVYDNTAELVQFLIPTGRITNFASTVGNIKLNGNRSSFESSLDEVDTTTTETVRLTPPTGQDFRTVFVSNNRGAINAIVGITGIAILSIVGVAVVSGTVGKKKSYK